MYVKYCRGGLIEHSLPMKAVNLGDDTDTVAAVAGSLAGREKD